MRSRPGAASLYAAGWLIALAVCGSAMADGAQEPFGAEDFGAESHAVHIPEPRHDPLSGPSSVARRRCSRPSIIAAARGDRRSRAKFGETTLTK